MFCRCWHKKLSIWRVFCLTNCFNITIFKEFSWLKKRDKFFVKFLFSKIWDEFQANQKPKERNMWRHCMTKCFYKENTSKLVARKKLFEPVSCRFSSPNFQKLVSIFKLFLVLPRLLCTLFIDWWGSIWPNILVIACSTSLWRIYKVWCSKKCERSVPVYSFKSAIVDFAILVFIIPITWSKIWSTTNMLKRWDGLAGIIENCYSSLFKCYGTWNLRWSQLSHSRFDLKGFYALFWKYHYWKRRNPVDV